MSDHEWKSDRCHFDLFDDPHQHEADELSGREEVDAKGLTVTQVDVVRLVLDWHEEDRHSFDELSNIIMVQSGLQLRHKGRLMRDFN